MTNPEEEIYEIYVSYDAETDDLSGSLEFLSKVISNLTKADRIIASGLETELFTKIVLNDIKKSSIRLLLANAIKNTNEDNISNKGAIAFWNQFLIEVRKPFLDYASKHETLEKRDDLIQIRQQAVQIARDNGVNTLPIEGMSDELVAECLSNYAPPLGLSSKQVYKAKCGGQEFTVNKKFKLTPDQIENILNGEEQKLNDQIVYLKPKVAVYEGDGMWDFHESKGGKVVKGKILDNVWLSNFQEQRMSPKEYPYPGTVLKALADIVVKFDESNFRKGETYFIKKMYGPIPPQDVPQHRLDGI